MNRFEMLEKSREQMKTALGENKSRRIRLPRKGASYGELSSFFDGHDGADLLDLGIMEVDPGREDLNGCCWSIGVSRTHSTLVRIRVIESMRREAALP
jgi:hypothetical protein